MAKVQYTCSNDEGECGVGGYCADCPFKLIQDLQDENKRLKEGVEDLQDRLNNGIKYDDWFNMYIVVWTQRELDQAKKDAEELFKGITWGPTVGD